MGRQLGRNDPARVSLHPDVHLAPGPAFSRAVLFDQPLAGPTQDVMEGRIQPGRVFDRTVGLDGVPEGYRAMNEREALKVMVRP